MITTIAVSILFLLTISIAVLPMSLYGKHFALLDRFNQRLTHSVNARRLYVNVCLIVLLIFHCLYLHITGHNPQTTDAIPSTAITLIFFSYQAINRLFLILRHRGTFYTVSLVSLVCLFVPHYFTLSVTLAIVLIGAMFFRSSEA